MSWNSGECHGPEPEPRRRPRMVWGQATHYAGIVDTVNPGHWPAPEPNGEELDGASDTDSHE